MPLPMALFTYAVTWFISLFLLLPSARARSWGFRRVLFYNSLLAALITLGIHGIIESGWIDVRGE